jgi:hypothetical protein
MIAGRWHYLWKIKYRRIRPAVWLDEVQMRKQPPKLYHSLVIARNTLDTYASILAPSEITIWKGENG